MFDSSLALIGSNLALRAELGFRGAKAQQIGRNLAGRRRLANPFSRCSRALRPTPCGKSASTKLKWPVDLAAIATLAETPRKNPIRRIAHGKKECAGRADRRELA